ncbi:MAG: PA0069 family radical SAM protein [Planctomycetota bacterium]
MQSSEESPHRRVVRGRGAQSQPANPHLAVNEQPDYEHFDGDEEFLQAVGRPATTYRDDLSQSIVSENRSPDLPFRYSINPYRGCAHGCSYCYARPTHEYLGFSAGLDFETKVLVKRDAAELFQRWLARPRYLPAPVMFSGVTDCYQPIERTLRLTRECLCVALACSQPVGCVTKNALVTRDLDLWSALAERGVGQVAVSLTTLDASLARVMEPCTSSPPARLRAIEALTEAGVPVHVMLAPLIPGLNDSEAPALLAAAREAGASSASHILLRLPSTVRPVFIEWLEAFFPDKVDRVVGLLKSSRGGRMNDPRFGSRMRGEGAYAEQLAQTVSVVSRKLGFAPHPKPLRSDLFKPPVIAGSQRRLF